MKKSRRALLQSMVGTFLLPLIEPAVWHQARAASLSVEQLRRRPGDPVHRTQQAYYRADATILLLSLPIHKRRGVGGGVAELEQGLEGNRKTLCIRFSAGSYPEQARGLNRLGYIEEVIVAHREAVEELAYFGFMTSSPEKDVAEARRALADAGQTAGTYKAAEGHIRSGVETSRKSTLRVAENYCWAQMDPLLACVRTAFLGDTQTEAQTTQCQGAPATFLYSLLSAAWGRNETFSATYRYLAKSYRLEVVKKPDPETGRRLAQDGLTQSPETVVGLKGTIRELGSGKAVRFRLWIEDTGRRELPIRFEYKARSFLRVSFERDPSQRPGGISSNYLPHI